MSSDRFEVLDGWVEERHLGGVGVEQRDVVAGYEASAVLARIIHECFYCNRRDVATTSVAASFARPADRLALRGLDILFQVCLGLSGLRVSVSHGVSAVSSRTIMNNAG